MFGDESGGPGMGLRDSPTFTLAMTLFEREEEAAACEQTIIDLKVKLGVSQFHWVDLSDAWRTAFLNAVSKHNFYYVVQTLDKKRVKHRDFQKKAFFYQRVAEKMANGVEDFLRIAQACSQQPLNMRVLLDRHGDKDYMRAMGEHLHSIKGQKGQSLVGKVSSRNALNCERVQLADMVCGAVLHPPLGNIIKGKKWKEELWP